MAKKTIKSLMDDANETIKKMIKLDTPETYEKFSEFLKSLSNGDILNISYFLALTNIPVPSSNRMEKELKARFKALPEIDSVKVKRVDSKGDESSDDSSDDHEIIMKSLAHLMNLICFLKKHLDNLDNEDCCTRHDLIRDTAVKILEEINVDSVIEKMKSLANFIESSRGNFPSKLLH